jgi:hypothetical protein
MINQVAYDIKTTNGPVHLTITPVNQLLPGGNYYATGVFKLSDGLVGMGNITFDADMKEWSYDGLDELTYNEAAEVAEFIMNYKDPQGADPDLLQ